MPVLVLLGWPFVMSWMFNRYDRQQALILSLLVGYLLLPPLLTFFIPGIPGFDKHTIPSMFAALFLAGKRSTDPFPEAPRMGLGLKLVLAVFLVTPLLTNLMNPDVLVEGNFVRPGLNLASGIKETIRAYVLILPFLLGYRYLYDYRGARLFCGYLLLAMLWYSIPMLIEVRLSPQLNVWVYGYFQHDFLQTIRYGGFRPIVFLEHPLWVASITSVAFVCSIGLARISNTRKAWVTAAYMAGVLFICKSAGSLMLGLMFAPLIALWPPRRVLMIASVAVVFATAYPVLRTTPLIPLQGIVNLAMSTSPERGRSLEFRLMNEEELMKRAMEKPMLGWGGSGRSLIVDPYDGDMLAVPDGLWVIYMGSRGIIGYLATFLLLSGPVIMAWRAVSRHRATPTPDHVLLAAMGAGLAMNVVDLIPNATMTSITWLLAGTLLGNAVRVYRGSAAAQPDAGTADLLPAQAGKRGLATIL